MHGGDRFDVDGVGPMPEGGTLTIIVDQERNMLVFDLWSVNDSVTTVEPWPFSDGDGPDLSTMTAIPAFTMAKKGQKLYVCEPHDPNNPEHRHR